MITIWDNIPVEHFNQWHSIFVITNGRYLSNPYQCGPVMHVHYTPGDYKRQGELWESVRPRPVEPKSHWRKIRAAIKKLFTRVAIS